MRRVILPLGAIGLLVMGCQAVDGPTAPSQAKPVVAPGGALSSSSAEREDTLRALRRTFNITSRLSTSQVIGPAGGEIVLYGTGARVVFPAGAVRAPTLITMSARPGTEVVYDFQPHMVFPVPVMLVQELGGTNAIGNPKLLGSLLGGYYDGDLDQKFTDASHRFVKCKEVLPGILDPGGRKFSFLISHFSGYLASSGRGGMQDNNDQ